MEKLKSSKLTLTDKKILKILLLPNCRVTSKTLAKRLGLPASNIQRHRKRLEKYFLSHNYNFDIAKFGWHKVEFLIATESGKTNQIAKSLLKRDEITYVGKSIGQHTIDLRVETILENNSEILRMLELLKAIDGVKDVMWSEVVEVIGKKSSIPLHVIDQL